MKKLTEYLLETVFDTTIDNASETLSAKTNAQQFLKIINRSERKYEIKNNTILSKTNGYIDKTLKVFSQGELLIGSIDGSRYAMPIDEYSKTGFYWGGDVTLEYTALKKGIKLKDLRLSPGDDHTINITALGSFPVPSKELSKLLDGFVGDALGFPENNLVLVLGEHGRSLPTNGIDYLGDKKLSAFNSIIYCASRENGTMDLNDIVNCQADSLMIAFGYDAAFPQDVRDLCKKYNLQLTCKDIYNIVNGQKYPKIEEKLVPLLTNLAKNNPKTNIYFGDSKESGNIFNDVLKISYGGGKLSTRYLSSLEL